MFNTFFYPLLVKGYHKVRRWTRKLKIFELDILLAPIHLVNHWCLVSVDFKRKIIAYHDSLGGSNRRILHLFKQYLQEEHMDKLNSPFDTSNWKLHSLKNTIPLQTNGADCGVFTCVYAECISRSAFFDFSQDDMPYFRKRLAIEILNKRLCMPQTP
ncbi:sentrin-specific protease 1-like [Zophobas morio]|uniref:sentrin-specific protease 1-like n=1 Tax=Zophobas morio TaxID=2755281 RepID=UPI0030836039